jgi:hypothetical protein
MTPESSSKLLAALQRMQTLTASGQAHPHELMAAHVDVAHAYVDELALAPAEAHLERALSQSLLMPGVDGRVDLLCELAELAARSAEREKHSAHGTAEGGSAARRRARQHAAQAASLAAQVSDPSWEIKVLLRVSDVFDRCGNHDEAVELQSRAMRLMAGELDGALAQLAKLVAAA